MIHQLFTAIQNLAPFQSLRRRAGRERLAVSLVDSAKPLAVAALASAQRNPFLVVTHSQPKAAELASQIRYFSVGGLEVHELPAHDAWPYEPIETPADARRRRAVALSALLCREPAVVVTAASNLLAKMDRPESYLARRIALAVGERIPLTSLLERLAAAGYQPADLVVLPGQFARRGGIVDLFPIDAEAPYRIDFFGDEIDSIRRFDVETQRSGDAVEQVVALPPAEIGLDDNDVTHLLGRLNDLSHFREDQRRIWEDAIAEARSGHPAGLANLAGAAYAEADIWSYAEYGQALVILDEQDLSESAIVESGGHAEAIYADSVAMGAWPAALDDCHWPAGRAAERLAEAFDISLSWRHLGPAADGRHTDLSFDRAIRPVASYGGRMKLLLDDLYQLTSRQEASAVIVSQQSQRIRELAFERNIPIKTLAARDDRLEPAVYFDHGSLAGGFRMDLASSKIVILSDAELFGWRRPPRAARSRSAARERFLADLAPGDHVVHIEHGIGRYAGIRRIEQDGVARDYLEIEYASGDRLYVPTDQSDRVNRYIGPSDRSPTTHRLGASDWLRAKSRVRSAVRLIAKELLDLYAARQVLPGRAFAPDTVWMDELADSFPFQETPDQMQAIVGVTHDMEQPHPMDRLICGDVGYGKTEVALRAAFKAVVDGTQVALLAPTTVLAQQHYNTFRERLQAFPVRVEMLSRFRSDREQRQIVTALIAGSIDICIGTHRLLQQDVRFKELGLIIIDEEQRFGVSHKEHLKQLRREVDVLTLTATPIPRTLHMSLSGIRDMTTMDTPPEDRLPINTHVAAYEDRLVRDAILREIYRGGQVYFVHNRVHSIYHAAHRLSQLVPEASFAVGHGQMAEDDLERVMLDFVAARYDVLVCTTIIESGLDIPNVNTIIVNDADRFGLAQLYQLRGRVGRGANRAYAYFLHRKNRALSEIADKRLRTIYEATELGAGFQIALKDLEIRGAGNLLGAEQHGQMASVGFHLYTQLLGEAVLELKGEPVQRLPSVSIDLPLPAFLPIGYVPEEANRLNLYQRLAAVTDEEQIDQIVQEIADRFGPPPEPTMNLCFAARIRLLASHAGVESIGYHEGRIVLRLGAWAKPARQRLRQVFHGRANIGNLQINIPTGSDAAPWQTILEELLQAMVEDLPAAPAPTPSAGHLVTPAKAGVQGEGSGTQ